ncbi:Hsp20/alpha crystallin family protein [Sulfurimonas sp.]|uniref:Hsp20/alpha crystallin family protein n=1 Tax=Sulfurimonas sp. TaxID=2022749 RepID=UPI0035697513
MFLTKYNPFDEFKDFSSRFNSLLSEFDNRGSSLSGFVPVVNTREGEYAYHVDADLPGVKKEDIKIDVKDDVLTISGERHHKEEVKEDDYHRIETSFGKFERSFTLPKGADIENITASSKDGVLEVIIPKQKSEAEKAKKIEVK